MGNFLHHHCRRVRFNWNGECIGRITAALKTETVISYTCIGYNRIFNTKLKRFENRNWTTSFSALSLWCNNMITLRIKTCPKYKRTGIRTWHASHYTGVYCSIVIFFIEIANLLEWNFGHNVTDFFFFFLIGVDKFTSMHSIVIVFYACTDVPSQRNVWNMTAKRRHRKVDKL